MKASILLACCFVVSSLLGCVNVRTPDVQINTGPPPENVDSSRVPPTATHEEARAELVKAYNHIRYLEHENARLREKRQDALEDRDEYKRKYKRLKDKYDD